MLKKIRIRNLDAGGNQFAIVASRYNRIYVDAMLEAAEKTLRQAGANAIDVIRVPGAYEIPVAVARLARTRRDDLGAIICLGVIIRGATTHAQHIGEAVTAGLTQVQVAYEVPVIHEVLLLENEEQARERCLDRKRNRGVEAAQTALEMAQIMRSLRGP